MKIPASVPTEKFDVFHVRQLTRTTSLEKLVAVDDVTIEPGQTSRIHRHNRADTVLYIVGGSGTVRVGDTDHPVRAGDRIHIAPGQYHGIRTAHDALHFISVQSPPIQDDSSGILDLEELRD